MQALTGQHIFDLASLVVVVAAVAFVAWRSLQKSVEPAALALQWAITVGLIIGTLALCRAFPPWLWPVIVLIPAMTIGIIWAPSLGAIVANVMSGGMDGGTQELEPQPLYSLAESKRRNNNYEEAARAVREQLEKFPGDFPGVMLLASIQAEDLKDLSAAQATLENWIAGPAATLQGTASALTALADWHLQFARNPEAARVCLQRIVQTMPDTPLAHRAAQRLANLPTVEHLMTLHQGAPREFHPGEKNIGLRHDLLHAAADGNPDALAETCVKQLEQHPADTATREKLAVLYADHYQRLDLAADQLEQLITFPNESPKHIAHWLNLLATLHIRVGRDPASAEAALRRILARFPNTALVDPTLARLASLNGEMKAGEKTQLKKLGQYEKQIGLKPLRE